MDSKEIIANESHLFKFFSGESQIDIRIAGTSEAPWFCSKDVCLVLGLENNRKALSRINPKYVGVTSGNTPGGRQNMTYVNECGLYNLIFTSKKEVAKQFQEWVFSEVLPALRKQGRYELESEIKSKDELISQLEHDKKEAENRTLKLQSFIQSTQKLEKKEVIYVGTSDVYQRQNRYKVGGCKADTLLRGRFSQYNTGRPSEDRFYCTHKWHVHNYTDIEKRVKTLLAGFKDNQAKDKEMYHMYGTSLVEALDFIINNAEEDMDWINDHLNLFMHCTTESEPIIFKPIELFKEAKLTITYNDTSIELGDISNWSQEKIDAEIEAILQIYKQRRSLENPIMWTDLRDIIKKKHNVKRMGPWRDLFKEFIPRRSERIAIKWREAR